MPASIGLRFYKLSVRKKRSKDDVSIDDTILSNSLIDTISGFIEGRANGDANDISQRVWYFPTPAKKTESSLSGSLTYGMFGHESNLVDIKQKKTNYKRKTSDAEEIPLFYKFWWPNRKNYIIACFQSFQGRSCINSLLSQLSEKVTNCDSNYRLHYEKVSPSGAASKIYEGAAVKGLRFVSKKKTTDIADEFVDGAEVAEFELFVRAQRKRSFGSLDSIVGKMPKGEGGIVMVGGAEYDEVFADVLVGDKRRKVGLYGRGTDFGLVDVTSDVEFGDDGHPSHASLLYLADEMMFAFNKVIGG